MSIQTSSADYRITHTAEETGWLSRIMSRIVRARQAQAQRAVNAYLLSLDDTTLEQLGYDRARLEKTNPGGYPFL